jgi:molecular chaperone Hsp33
MRHQDQLLRFSFDELDVRGELVYLDTSWREILDRYDYPANVRRQLGNALAAVALLSVTLKFKGAMILQIQGSGPLRSLVTQVTSAGTLRGLARWEGTVPDGPLRQVYGKAHIVISILPEDGERYQSIVELTGDTLAAALNAYFRQSEQLPSSFRISVTGERVAGFFLQALPMSREHAFSEEQREEDWTRLNLLADTMAEEELLELSPATLLRRLYHEETVHLHDPKPLHFACTCSLEKVERTLLTLGREELESIIRDEGSIKVDCEFCNQHYSFDAAAVERLCREAGGAGPVLH